MRSTVDGRGGLFRSSSKVVALAMVAESSVHA